MSTDELNRAIELIKQGQDESAQAILEGLIRDNQQDLTAWSWYVRSFRTPEKRLEALEVSLHFNPGNPQIIEAIEKMREKLAPKPSPSYTVESTPVQSISPRDVSPYAVAETPASFQQSKPVSQEPTNAVGLDDVTGDPIMWWNVWWFAVSTPKENMYTALLQDPLASVGRASWWVFLSSLVVWIVSLFNPALLQLVNETVQTENGAAISTFASITTLLAIPFAAVFSVLSMMLSALFYSLMAKLMGGTGNFSRTFYLMAAHRAPIDMALGILAMIPCVNVISIPLSFYSFWLNVVSIQTAHRLNVMRAVLALLLPSFVLIGGICLLGVALAGPLSQILQSQ